MNRCQLAEISTMNSYSTIRKWNIICKLFTHFFNSLNIKYCKKLSRISFRCHERCLVWRKEMAVTYNMFEYIAILRELL